MNCPSCGARNPERADWCSQCFARFGPSGPVTAAAGDADVSALRDGPEASALRDDSEASALRDGPDVSAAGASGPEMDGRSRGPGELAEDESPRAAGEGRPIRERDGQVEWRCRRCGTWSVLTEPGCATCGAPREGFASPTEHAAPRDLDARLLIGSSLLVPGAGHLVYGATGTGVARAILWLLWSLTGISLLRGGAVVSGLVLLVGAGTLWVATLLDVSALARGRKDQLLRARPLGALVMAVTAGLLLTMMRFAGGA